MDAAFRSARVNMNEAGQLTFLEQVCPLYRPEYERFASGPTGVPHEFYHDQYMFRAVDAEVLYCMVRHYQPGRILEIGSGFSTLVSAPACRANQAQEISATLTCIEPYPNDVLRKGFPGLTKLIAEPLENVALSMFTSLGENDVLFIDSSHVLRIGNDVHREYLEILPRLAPGVLVHVHDIFLPFEHPRQWVTEEFRFWTEQYLLQAFLAFNSAYEALWGGCDMHARHPDRLRAAFSKYDPQTVLPGSFWMRRRT